MGRIYFTQSSLPAVAQINRGDSEISYAFVYVLAASAASAASTAYPHPSTKEAAQHFAPSPRSGAAAPLPGFVYGWVWGEAQGILERSSFVTTSLELRSSFGS